MDLHLGEDFYDSFIEYQTRMLKVFDRMSDEFGFHVLNASLSVRSVASDLRRSVGKIIDAANVEDTTPSSSVDKAPPAPINLAEVKKKALS